MKRVVLLLSVIVALCSCSEKSKMESALKDYVINQAGPMSEKIKYELDSYNVTDTIKASDRLNALRMEILENGSLWDDATKDSLLKIRDTKFPEFLMEGYTLEIINKHKQTVDSLVNKWDSVSVYSFALNYEEIWFFSMDLKACGSDVSKYEEAMNWMVENKEKYEEAETISKKDPSEVFGYRVEHSYSIFNPLLDKNVNITNIVILDKDLKYVSSENANSFDDILKQMID